MALCPQPLMKLPAPLKKQVPSVRDVGEEAAEPCPYPSMPLPHAPHAQNSSAPAPLQIEPLVPVRICAAAGGPPAAAAAGAPPVPMPEISAPPKLASPEDAAGPLLPLVPPAVERSLGVDDGDERLLRGGEREGCGGAAGEEGANLGSKRIPPARSRSLSPATPRSDSYNGCFLRRLAWEHEDGP
ncbi:unnamed protein product [Urochloa humidicola]